MKQRKDDDLDLILKVEKPENTSENVKKHLKDNKLGQLKYNPKAEIKTTLVRMFLLSNKLNLII